MRSSKYDNNIFIGLQKAFIFIIFATICTATPAHANDLNGILNLFGKVIEQGARYEERERQNQEKRRTVINNIRELQRILQALGYYRLDIDGSWGPSTDAAFREFQLAYGLDANLSLEEVLIFARRANETNKDGPQKKLSEETLPGKPTGAGDVAPHEKMLIQQRKDIGDDTVLPIGAGLPNGHPIDIAGFHSGMEGEIARPLAEDTYRISGISANIELRKIVYSDLEPSFIYILPQQFDPNKPHDIVSLVLSTPSSGNQVHTIGRDVAYEFDNSPNLDVFVDSVIEKYGKPTETKKMSSGIRIIYKYDAGSLLSEGMNNCQFFSSSEVSVFDRIKGTPPGAQRNPLIFPNQHIFTYWLVNYYNMYTKKQQKVCDAYLQIELYFAALNRSGSKIMGETFVDNNRVMAARTLFFDIKRFIHSYKIDGRAIEQIKNDAKKLNEGIRPKL